MTDRIYNVLVLCTGNSSRSIMAEALINKWGAGRFHAYSAGSHPTGQVNSFALEKVQVLGFAPESFHSKSWTEFARPESPKMDFIITVCDKAAGETCPIWPGYPISAHWGFEDPAAVEGSDEEKRQAFDKVFKQITRRVQAFTSLPIALLDRAALKYEMDKIGQLNVSENV